MKTCGRGCSRINFFFLLIVAFNGHRKMCKDKQKDAIQWKMECMMFLFLSLFFCRHCSTCQTSSWWQNDKLYHWIISSEKMFHIFLICLFWLFPPLKNEGGAGGLKIPPRVSLLMGSYVLFLSALLFGRPGRRQRLPFSSPLASTTTCPSLIHTT